MIPLALTPDEIRDREFKQRWVSGYDMDEVETFLKNVGTDFETLLTENEDLHGRIKSMEGELDDFRTKRRHLEEALISAQCVIDEMKVNAKKEADLILKDAELQADRWIADANTQVLEIKREFNELQMLRRDYEVKFKSLLESHMELLEGMRAPERRDGRTAQVRKAETPAQP